MSKFVLLGFLTIYVAYIKHPLIMRKFSAIVLLILISFYHVNACDKCVNYKNASFKIKSTSITHLKENGMTLWEITLDSIAGVSLPRLQEN